MIFNKLFRNLIFSKYPNPIIVVTTKLRIIYMNEKISHIRQLKFFKNQLFVTGSEMFSVLNLKDEDQFKIRKFASELTAKHEQEIYLNYSDIGYYIKIYQLYRNEFVLEFVNIKKIHSFVHDFSAYFGLSNNEEINELKNIRNQLIEKNIKIQRMIDIYNDLSVSFNKVDDYVDLFHLYDSIINQIVDPFSIDFLIENASGDLDNVFSKNSVSLNNRIKCNEIGFIVDMLEKKRKPITLSDIQSEISSEELQILPGLSGKNTVILIPVLKENGINGIIILSFNDANYISDELDLNIIFGISSLAAVTYDKIKSLKEQDQLRTAIYQQEKLIIMGRIIAGVAHEINNPLSIMQLDLDELRSSVKTAEIEHIELFNSLQEEIVRMRGLVKQLKDYAKPEAEIYEKKEIVHVDELFKIYPVKILMKSFIKAGTVVNQNFSVDMKKVNIPKTRLIQVLMNILTNAQEALSSGKSGEMIINTYIEEKTNVVIEIIDNGCGIEKDNINIIFDPFFTTKKGSGTGLGLSISYSLMKKFGGNILVESQPGVFSKFKIILPLYKEQ